MIAHRIGEDATVRGFAVKVAELDSCVGKLPTTGAVVIVTASYNGTPTDNAARFVAWLAGADLKGDALKGVRYMVFGCGDHDWADTFQRIPRLIDQKLAEHGAERIYAHGEGDQSADFDDQFRSWYAEVFGALAKSLDIAAVDIDHAALGPRYQVAILEGAPGVADEFAAMERDGVVALEPAYSRPDTGQKQYVQQRLVARRDRVWELIEQGGIVYVCGDAGTMAPAVEQAFVDICSDRRGITRDDATAWLASMKASARYLVDIWPKG